MEYFKKLFHLPETQAEEDPGETVVVSEPRTVLEAQAPVPPQAEIEAPPAALHGFFEPIFSDYLRHAPPYMAILFDPEEEQCFVYYFHGGEMKKMNAIPLHEWEPRREHLKSLNHRRVTIGGVDYLLGILISFSNFGERICIILQPLTDDADLKLREKLKNAIKLENALKPATSLTELNKEHLAAFIERQRKKREESLADILVREGLLSQELREECEKLSGEGHTPESLMVLRGVFPRKLLTRIVAGWAGFDYCDIDDEEIDYSQLETAGSEFCRQRRIIPYGQSDTEVFIAAANPGDEDMKAAVESLFGRKALVKMSAEEDIRNQTVEIFRRLQRDDRAESSESEEGS
jgi:hypothetical protein